MQLSRAVRHPPINKVDPIDVLEAIYAGPCALAIEPTARHEFTDILLPLLNDAHTETLLPN